MGERLIMRLWTARILFGLSLCILPGCLTLFKYSGSEIQAARVAQIQPGKTLKKETLEWFGAPMVISARDEIVVVPKASVPDNEYRIPRRPTVVNSDTFFDLFSSKVEFTEYHRVYYFYFSESKDLTYYFLVAKYDKIETKLDKLWLLVDEKTGIVEDYFFKKGIRANPTSG
jgi:hypothetical protein